MRTRVAVVLTFLGILGSVLAQQQCITSAESDDDIFEVKPEQEFSTVFKVFYPGDSTKSISIYNADGTDLYGEAQDGIGGERKFFFRQCGSDLQPPSDAFPGFNVELPVEYIVVSSTTQIGQLMVLNKIDTVAVYIGNVEWVTDQCFADRTIDATEVQYTSDQILVYKDQTAFADALEDPLNINRARLDELLGSKRMLGLGPLGEGWGGDERFVTNEDQSGLIPHIPVYASKEKSGKAIFEWNEFYGALFNLEKESRRVTLIKEKRWDCIANKVEKKWNEAIFEDAKPKVCWAYYLADDYGYGSPGWVWGNQCQGKPDTDDYYCKLADVCHATLGTGPGNAWSENIIDHETTATMFEDCYAIIYSSYYRNIADPVENEDETRKMGRAKALSVLQNTEAWRNGQVYDVTYSGSSNWHENRIIHYDRLLEDFCEVAERHSKHKFYKRLFLRMLGPLIEEEGKDDECIKISVTDSATGRRLETNCNTIATQQQCHKPEYAECKRRTAMCQLQKQCINKIFLLKYKESNTSKQKRIRCNRIRNRKGLVLRKKKFTCNNKLIARNCAKRCGECCPQLG